MIRAALLALLLSGCVTAHSSMMSANTAVISAKGMGWNESTADLMSKAEQVAARLGAKRGFAYFAFEGATDTTTSGSVYLPGSVSTNSTGSIGCFGAYCNLNSTSTTTGYGPREVPYVRPGADIYVRFYKAGDAIPEGAFNIAQALAQK